MYTVGNVYSNCYQLQYISYCFYVYVVSHAHPSTTTSLQSEESPIAEAFIDVQQKDAQFDMFSPNSGRRLGYFKPEGVCMCCV